jgi:hypothetical protein
MSEINKLCINFYIRKTACHVDQPISAKVCYFCTLFGDNILSRSVPCS